MTESFLQKITPLILHLLRGDVTFFSSLKLFFFFLVNLHNNNVNFRHLAKEVNFKVFHNIFPIMIIKGKETTKKMNINLFKVTRGRKKKITLRCF